MEISPIQDGTYLTHKGSNLIAKLMGTKTPLTFTKATIGRGSVPPGTVPEAMEELTEYVMDGYIVSVQNPGVGEASVLIQAINLDMPTGFDASEVALWADDPDEGEILYTIMLLPNHPVWISANSAPLNTLAEFEMIVIIKDVQLVNAIIHPAGLVRFIDLQRYALIGHRHVIGDIDGLEELLAQLRGEIDLLKDLVSGDMPGGIVFEADFAGLSNVQVIDGVLDPHGRTLSA